MQQGRTPSILNKSDTLQYPYENMYLGNIACNFLSIDVRSVRSRLKSFVCSCTVVIDIFILFKIFSLLTTRATSTLNKIK